MGGARTLRAQRIPASGHLPSTYCSIDLGRGSGHPKNRGVWKPSETDSSGTLEETSCSTGSAFPRTLQATSTVGLAGLQAPQRARFLAETLCVVVRAQPFCRQGSPGSKQGPRGGGTFSGKALTTSQRPGTAPFPVTLRPPSQARR